MSNKNKHLIDGVEPKYYARIPNMVIDDLNYSEIALYTYYKRVAYDTGSCWQSTATIGKSLGMSPKKVRSTRRALENKKLIHMADRDGSTKIIRIINIWQENIDRYNCTPVQNDPPLDTKRPTPESNRTHEEKPIRKTNKENKDSAPNPGAQNADGDNGRDGSGWKLAENTARKIADGCVNNAHDQCVIVGSDYLACLECEYQDETPKTTDTNWEKAFANNMEQFPDCPVCEKTITHGDDYLKTPDGITHVDCLDDKPIVADLVAATPRIPPEVLDNTFMGTREAPVIPTDVDWTHDAPTTVKDVEPKAAKPKKTARTPEQKQAEDNMYEAVKFTWRINDKGNYKIIKMKQFFLGTVKKTNKKYGTEFRLNQLDELPANAIEVIAFGHWYRTEYDNATLPENGSKLRSHFETFRGSGDRYETFMRKAVGTARGKIPNITLPGDDNQEQPKTKEDEIMELTPEQLQQVKDAYANIGHGGAK